MDKNEIATMRDILGEVADTVVKKDRLYGSSWKSHGGFSAFFNLDRKMSRVQTMIKEAEYDLFRMIRQQPEGEDVLRDLIAYSVLALTEVFVTDYEDIRAGGVTDGEASDPEEDAPRDALERLNRLQELEHRVAGLENLMADAREVLAGLHVDHDSAIRRLERKIESVQEDTRSAQNTADDANRECASLRSDVDALRHRVDYG